MKKSGRKLKAYLFALVLLVTVAFVAIAYYSAAKTSYLTEVRYAEGVSSYIEKYLESGDNSPDEDITDLSLFFDPFVLTDMTTGECVYAMGKDGKRLDASEAENPNSFIFAAKSFYDVGNYSTVVNGAKYSVHSSSVYGGNYSLVQFSPKNSWLSPVMLIGVTLAFICMAILVCLYVIYVKDERREHAMRSVIIMVLLCTFVGAVLASYSTRLLGISATSDSIAACNQYLEETFEKRLRGNEIQKLALKRKCAEAAKSLVQDIEHADLTDAGETGEKLLYRSKDENGNAVSVKNVFDEDTICVSNSPILKELASNAGCYSLKVYDTNGRCIASSDDDWDEQISSEKLRDVLDRRVKSYSELEEEGSARHVVVAFPLTLSGGDNEIGEYGMMKACFKCPPYVQTDNGVFAEAVDLMSIMSLADLLRFEDDEQHTLSYKCPELSGFSNDELRLDGEEAFSGDYIGIKTIGGDKYLVRVYKVELEVLNKIESCYLAYFVKSETKLISTYLSMLPWQLMPVAFILLLGMALLILKNGNDDIDIVKIKKVHLESYSIDDGNKDFDSLSAEEKIKKIARIMGYAVLLLICIDTAYSLSTNSNSLVCTMWRGDWDRGINIISLSAILLIALFFALLIWLTKLAFTVASPSLDSESKTLFRLVISIFSYAATIFCIFYSLYLLGMNVTAVLTSLGAFSLLIGLGAQSLIKDIIEGFFIILEGQFRIGDVVEIGGYTGTVKEIGLRTCKFEKNGDIKSICNSSITNVVNKTRLKTKIEKTIFISYYIDPDDVRRAYEAELPGAAERHPEMIGGIEYDGVTKVDEYMQYTYEVGFITWADEKNRRAVESALNEEVLKIARDYGFITKDGRPAKLPDNVPEK